MMATIATGERCWLAAYTRSRHEMQVVEQLKLKEIDSLLPTFIADCVEGLLRLMASTYREPLNLGTEEMVTVDQLVDLVSRIAGKDLIKRHDLSKPQGVRGRNSDNSRLRSILGWEPQTVLSDGLRVTYDWIEQELQKTGHLTPALEYAS